MPEQLYFPRHRVSRVAQSAGVPSTKESTNLQLRHLVEQDEDGEEMRQVPEDPKNIERHGEIISLGCATRSKPPIVGGGQDATGEGKGVVGGFVVGLGCEACGNWDDF